MSFFGKVARLRLLGAAGVVLTLSASSMALPLAPDGVQWKTHASVPDTPKYTLEADLPGYMLVPGNIIATGPAVSLGALGATTTSTVYRDPATGNLTFEYLVVADAGNTKPIVDLTLEGPGWGSVQITNCGAYGGVDGISGGPMDANAEWTNGDPVYIGRDLYTGNPTLQFRTAIGGTSIGTVIGPGGSSARIWFETNAQTSTDDGTISFIGAGSVGHAFVMAPAPVPDPATLSLLGLLSVGALARRGRRI